MPTPRSAMPYLATNQSQKEVTHNEALNIQDFNTNAYCIDMTTTAPPGSPADGDAYIVAATATGEWEGMEKALAFYLGGWNFIEPYLGMRVFDFDSNGPKIYNGTNWIAEPSAGGDPYTYMETLEGDFVLSGADTTGLTIPDRSIVVSSSVRVIVAITGATSFDCGIAGEVSKFGGSLGIALNSSNNGVIGPTAFYSNTDTLFTANGSDFTGGTVRQRLHLIRTVVPDAV